MSASLTLLNVDGWYKLFTCREAARSSRTVGRKKKKKKGLMDLETLKPLFLVLSGIIISSFEPV